MYGPRGGNRTRITLAYLASALGVYKAPSLPILATRGIILLVLLGHLPVLSDPAHVVPVALRRLDPQHLAVLLILGKLDPLIRHSLVLISRPAQAIGVILIVHAHSPL